MLNVICCFFLFKQKTAYEMRISDWSSDVCSSDLGVSLGIEGGPTILADEHQCGVGLRIEVDHEDAFAHQGGERLGERDRGGRLADAALQVDGRNPMGHRGSTSLVSAKPGADVGSEEDRPRGQNSEARRVGKECVRTGRSRWWREH